MLYSKILYVLGFNHPSIQLVILIGLAVLAFIGFRAKMFSPYSFAPIALMLIMHIIEKLVYFFAIKKITDYETFSIIMLIIGILLIIGYKKGPFWVVAAIFSPIILGLLLYYIPLLQIVGIIVIALAIAHAKFALILIACLLLKFFFGLKWKESVMYLIIWEVLAFFNSMTALETILVLASLIESFKEDKKTAIVKWANCILIGFLLFYLIELAFSHIWLFIIIFFIFKFVLKIL